MFGVNAGLGFAVNDVTSINIFGGYEEDLEEVGGSHSARPTDLKSGWVVGANVIWQPVRQLRMGWEVNYGEAKTHGNGGAMAHCMDPVGDGSVTLTAASCADSSTTEALNLMWHTRFFF
jgi:hypothetical protein